MTWARVGPGRGPLGRDRGPGPAVAAVAGAAGGPGPSGTGWLTAPVNDWTWATMHLNMSVVPGRPRTVTHSGKHTVTGCRTPRPPNRIEPAGLACEAAPTAVPRHQANLSAPGTPDNRSGPGDWH